MTGRMGEHLPDKEGKNRDGFVLIVIMVISSGPVAVREGANYSLPSNSPDRLPRRVW